MIHNIPAPGLLCYGHFFAPQFQVDHWPTFENGEIGAECCPPAYVAWPVSHDLNHPHHNEHNVHSARPIQVFKEWNLTPSGTYSVQSQLITHTSMPTMVRPILLCVVVIVFFTHFISCLLSYLLTIPPFLISFYARTHPISILIDGWLETWNLKLETHSHYNYVLLFSYK